MPISYVCRKCGRVYSVEEYLADRFCRECGKWLFPAGHKTLGTFSYTGVSIHAEPMPPESKEWIGKRVRHPRWGEGMVQAQRHGLFELLIVFQNGVKTWVRRSECTLTTQEPIPPTIPATLEPPIVRPPTMEMPRPNQIIESLRLGIVPSQAIRKFTFGREHELEHIEQWLRNEDGGFFLLIGGYGSGKSHLVEYTRALALDMGYAVATCELDPNECPLHQPKKVYRKLIANFRFNNERNDFREFVRLTAGSNASSIVENLYISTVLNYVKRNLEYEDLWEWIEGGEVSSFYGAPKMFDSTTASNIYCNLLSAFGYISRKILNLKGLLVQLDEAEIIDSSWLYQYQRLRGRNFVHGLALVALNSEKLVKEGVEYSYKMGEGYAYRGNKTGLTYCGWNHVRYIYGFPSGLKIMFSAVPGLNPLDPELGSKMIIQMELLPFSHEEKQRIFNEIYKLYIEAHPNLLIEKNELEEIMEIVLERSEQCIRSLVKTTVEAFDLKRLYPTTTARKLLQ